MPRDYGRLEHVRRTGKWRAIGYKITGGESKLGEYDTRDEAVARLREHVNERTKNKRKRS